MFIVGTLKIGLCTTAYVRLQGENMRTNSVVHKRDRHTHKQKSTFLAAPVADEIRAPPNLAR